MKHFLLLLAALVCSDAAATLSQGSFTHNKLTVSYAQGQRGVNGLAGPYNVAAAVRIDWIGFVRELPLGDHFSLGLGFHFSGPEIVLKTTHTPVAVQGETLDLNRLLAARARIRFDDVMPYMQLGYRWHDRRQRLKLRVDTGLRLLRVRRVELDLGGELAAQLANRSAIATDLRRRLSEDLEQTYIEPVFSLNLRYRFS